MCEEVCYLGRGIVFGAKMRTGVELPSPPVPKAFGAATRLLHGVYILALERCLKIGSGREFARRHL
jgi:hypothetical protein